MSDVINGRYELLGQLGQGGYGAVYEAYDRMLSRHVALKQLHALNFGAHIKDRFLEEARISSQLTHPSALMIFDFGVNEHGDPFLVSELLNGVSLQDYLRDQACSPSQTLAVMISVAEALAEAHELGIIHRDLKPANLYVHLPPSKKSTGETVIKLLDFGIAKVIQEDGGGATKSGAIVGTPAYMAPEQIKDSSKVNARCDQYSLGLVGWSMLHGRPPFRGGNEFELMHKQVNEPLPPLEVEGEGCEALFAVIQRLASKEQDERFETMRDVISSLITLREEFDDLTKSSILPLREGDVSRELRPRSYTGNNSSIKFSELQKSTSRSPSSTMQQVGFESSMVTLDATYTEKSADRDIDDTLVPEELASVHQEQVTRLDPVPTPATAAYGHERDFSDNSDREGTPIARPSESVALSSPRSDRQVQTEKRDSAKEEQRAPELKSETFIARNFASPQLLLASVLALCAGGWWLVSSKEANVKERLHTNPHRPRLGGPNERQSATPLYRVALQPEPSTIGYPIGARFEVLLENRLGQPILDFEVRETPKCLEKISDPLRLLYQVINAECGLLVLAVDELEVSTSIQAQSLIDDVLQGIE